MLLDLILEKTDQNHLWGRVHYEDNLLVAAANTLPALETTMRQLLADFHGPIPEAVEFVVRYDLKVFFTQFDYLKISRIAKRAGINPSLVRHYAAGTKHPSAEQVQRLQTAIHALADELHRVQLAA